jgi:hypothetical protein
VGLVLHHNQDQTSRKLRSTLYRGADNALTNSNTHDIATETGKLRLKNLISQLTEVGIDTSPYATELALTLYGPDVNGTPSLGAEDSTFLDNRKLVLSLPSPSPSSTPPLTIVTVHLKVDSAKPLFLRVYRIPKPSSAEGEIVPNKPVPHTKAGINNTDMASNAVAGAT